MKKHILLLGGRTEIYELAKKYHFSITLFQEKNWMNAKDYDLVDRVIHAPIDADYLVKIAKILNEETPFDIVLCFLEAGLLNAAKIKEDLGILGNSLFPVEITRRKHKMRAFLEEKEIANIPYSLVSNEEDVESFISKYDYPIILKPSIGSGSRQIHKIYSYKEISPSLKSIYSQYPDTKIIAEKFIDGYEISVEGFSWNSQHKIIGITLKHTTGYPYFVETSHEFPAQLSPSINEKVENLVYNFLRTINHVNGPSHTEIIISNSMPHIIESHTRTGGDYIYELVENVTGFNFFDETFKSFADSKYSIDNIKLNTGGFSIIKYFSLEEGTVIEIKNNIKIEEFDNVYRYELNVQKNQKTKKFKNSEERYGYVIGHGKNLESLTSEIDSVISLIKNNVIIQEA